MKCRHCHKDAPDSSYCEDCLIKMEQLAEKQLNYFYPKRIMLSTAILLMALALLVGYFIGYEKGVFDAFNWGTEQAFSLLNKQGIDITIDPAFIAAGMRAYNVNVERFIKGWANNNATGMAKITESNRNG